MIPFGKCSLTRVEKNTSVSAPAELDWISSPKDWLFADEWEEAAKGTADSKKIDSVEFAKIAEGRWKYLRQRKECALSLEDARERSQNQPKSEYGFGIVVRMGDGRLKRAVGFMHVRWLWSGNFCLEYLGAFPPPGIKNIGVPLLNALAGIAVLTRADEVWGECTEDSQGFYQKLKTELMIASLQDCLKRKEFTLQGWQLPGTILDRFVFGQQELKSMSAALDVWQKDVDQQSTKCRMKA